MPNVGDGRSRAQVYRTGACLFACGALAFFSVSAPASLGRAAYNQRYKETLARVLLAFVPSTLLFAIVFTPAHTSIFDASVAFLGRVEVLPFGGCNFV